METLVVVAQHRNQYYTISKGLGHGSERFGLFESFPSKDFRGINCRTFQSGSGGILPTPVRSFSTPVTNKRAISPSFSPKTTPPCVNSWSEEPKNSKKLGKSSAIPIPMKLEGDFGCTELGGCFAGEFNFSERWAGPAYSNSPPPSSLPIPKFSIRPKKTVSLVFPTKASDIELGPISKSAPASPTRERSPSPRNLFEDDDVVSVDLATKMLRRILNLDLTGE